MKIFADVAWAFHAKFDDPFIPEYYNDYKTVKFVKGLEKEIDWVKDNQIVNLFTAPTISGAIGINLVRDFILDVIKDMADRYELGFTSY